MRSAWLLMTLLLGAPYVGITSAAADPLPAVTPILFGGPDIQFMMGNGDGVDAPSWDGVYHVTTTGVVRTLNGTFHPYEAAMDASGRLFTYDLDLDAYVAIAADGAATPVVRKAGGPLFTPEGALIGFNGTMLVRYSSDRSWVATRLPTGYILSYSPDGRIYGQNGVSVTRIDEANGTESAVYGVPGHWVEGLAFGADGTLFVSDRQGVLTHIERIDPGTGAHQRVTQDFQGFLANLAFSGSRLFVSYWHYPHDDFNADTEHAVAWVDLGVAGFSGFRPAFDLPPLSNLVARNFRVDRAPMTTPVGTFENDINEVRIIHATVCNEGRGALTMPAHVQVARSGIGYFHDASWGATQFALSTEVWTGITPMLRAGECSTFSWRWDTTSNVGGEKLRFDVDPFYDGPAGFMSTSTDEVVESNEFDNTLRLDSYVRAPVYVYDN